MISLISGDWKFFWPESVGSFANFPLSWDASLNTGIGVSAFSFIWINTYLNFTAFISSLGLPWSLVGFVFWILPVFLLSFASSYFLYKYIFPKGRIPGLLAGIIYASNTYILMIVSGGQLGVALGYSLVPLVILMFMKTIKNLNYKTTILFGLVFALELLFDPRISYLIGITILLYFLFESFKLKKLYKQFYFVLIIPLLVVTMLHSYWIIPMILFHVNSVPLGFDSVEGMKFFSFADFSHSFSLLHPNWPENIFGKTYFMKSEFIMLPILAFSSLLFFKAKRKILFLTTLGLLGAFFSKGANPPFGEISIWLFNNFPGFVVFRDPTKWYILVAISYSMLIPFVLSKISQKLGRYAYILFVIFWLSIMLPGIFGQAKNFKIAQVPKEYSLLKDFLVKDKDFYRTLWIPTFQRFGYFSNLHPAVRSPELFKEKDGISIVEEMGRPEVITLFKNLGIKYIIVPYDSEGEIFLKDREYDNVKYEKVIGELKKLEYLKQVRLFGKIVVFETPKPNDRFFIKNNELALVASYKMHNPTKYTLSISNARKGDILVFSEGFDVNWQAKTKTKLINSIPYDKLLNSFTLEEGGDYDIEVNYSPQQVVNVGVVISIAVVVFLTALLIVL